MQFSQLARQQIIEAARVSCEAHGAPAPTAIARDLRVPIHRVHAALRWADKTGALHRTCTYVLSSGRRCGEPLPIETRGYLKAKCCSAHSKIELSTQPRPSSESIASAGVGEVLPAKVVAHEAPAREPAPSIATPFDGITTAEMIDGEPRVSAIEIAKALGFEDLREIVRLVERNTAELKEHGEIHVLGTVTRTSMPRGGAREVEVKTPWLNEEQALAVASLSRTPRSREVRVMLIRAFKALKTAIASPPDKTDRLIEVVMAGQQQMMTLMATLIGGMAGRHVEATPVGSATPALGDGKNGDLDLTDISRMHNLPAGDHKQRSRALVKLWLELSGLWHCPTRSRSRMVLMRNATDGVEFESPHWLYRPSDVGNVEILHSIAEELNTSLRLGRDASVSFTDARNRLRRSFDAAA